MIALLLVAGLSFQSEVARLGDPRHEVRREACRRLLAAGTRAVPELLRALSARDVEVRRGAARILDHHVARGRKGKRNCKPYVIPDNRQTRTFRGGDVVRRQAVFLRHQQLMRHYGQHFRGVLAQHEWRAPTQTDYNGLLESLARHVRGTVEPEQGRCMLEHVFAVDALSWRVRLLPVQAHWAAKWIVRRRVLPDIALAISGRRRALSVTEAGCYRGLLAYLKPLCDPVSEAQRKQLLKRLLRP